MGYPVLMRGIIPSVLLSAFLLGGCGGDGPVTLQLSPSSGEKIRQWVVTDQKIEQKAGDTWQEVHQSIGIGTTYTVEDIGSDSTVRMRVVYDSVTVDQEGAGNPVHYNSVGASQDVPPLAAGYAAMLDQSFTLTLGPDGRLRRIAGVDSMLHNIIEKVARSNPSARSMIEYGVTSLLNEKSLTETMERSLAVYPDRPVSVGDTWSNVVSVTIGTPMTINTTYTLKDIHDGRAYIGLNSSIVTNQASGALELAGMSIVYQVSGTQSGSMQVDLDDGWIISSEIEQDFSGTMQVTPHDSSAAVASTTLPLRMHSRIVTQSWKP